MSHFSLFREIDHVAIAVENVDVAAQVYVEVFGASVADKDIGNHVPVVMEHGLLSITRKKSPVR